MSAPTDTTLLTPTANVEVNVSEVETVKETPNTTQDTIETPTTVVEAPVVEEKSPSVVEVAAEVAGAESQMAVDSVVETAPIVEAPVSVPTENVGETTATEVVESKVEETKPTEQSEEAAVPMQVDETAAPEVTEEVATAPVVPFAGRGVTRVPRLALGSSARSVARVASVVSEGPKDTYIGKPPVRSHTAVPRAPRTGSAPRVAVAASTTARTASTARTVEGKVETPRKPAVPRVAIKRALPTEEKESTTTTTEENPRPAKRARAAPTTTPAPRAATPTDRKSNSSTVSDQAVSSVETPRRAATVVGSGDNVWSRLYSGAQARKERTEERAKAARDEEITKLEQMKHFAAWRKVA